MAEKLKFDRLLCPEGIDPEASVSWRTTDAIITAADGTVKFEQKGIHVPEAWSDRAAAIVAEKFFRVVNGTKENDVAAMIRRVVTFIADEGYRQGYFGQDDAKIFENELFAILLKQMASFNSPVWFNVGVLNNPQASACFIQSVTDDMESITNLQKKEVMLFKGGSGTGTNHSALRSSYERLSGGGYASGPVSFMRGYDAWAGVTKSGGTTRRAAKMNILDVGHPDILEMRNGEPGFIVCKAIAEKVAHDLYETGKYHAEFNKPGSVYDYVPFQNANHSVRVPDKFMRAVEQDGDWFTKAVIDGEPVKVHKARDLWRAIAESTKICGDPGLQFQSTIKKFHTCPNAGPIVASNPCSEFMFIDDSACNLASLNLLMFLNEDGTFNTERFQHIVRVMLTAMDILVDAASYPSPEIQKNSHEFRPLGLGYTNLGALLMAMGLPYDSKDGRNVASEITSLLSATAYHQSALIAICLGAFSRHDSNKDAMITVLWEHKDAALKLTTPNARACVTAWENALNVGNKVGFRNAQVTLLAPTGTIAFQMDCDTTGMEPVVSLVQYKKLVGGGQMTMVSQVVARALKALGYSPGTIEGIIDTLETGQDIYESPFFQAEDEAVFAGALGKNAIEPTAHLKMMASIQPHVSGAISKTVNLPSTVTVEEIESLYMMAWKLGLKSVALYPDGCKLSQPVSATKDDHDEEPAAALEWGSRKRLGEECTTLRHKFTVGGEEGYFHIGMYEDGAPGEMFVRISKHGSSLNGLLDSLLIAISVGLQYGVPLRSFTDKFKGVRFEPSGFTPNPKIPMVTSLVDYLARYLEQKFMPSDEAPIEVAPKMAHHKAGYSGPPCGKCGNMTQRSGACWLCSSCGTTTGCG
jgi:ribonucleoside-diphosphate reductase alpha chain